MKVFLLIAFMSAPVSAWRVNFLSKEIGVSPQPNSIIIGLSSDVPERTYCKVIHVDTRTTSYK